MSRLLGLLVLALALLQGSGLDAQLAELACAGEHHEAEGPGEDCPPECATCRCCARVTFPPVSVALTLIEPADDTVAFGDRSARRLPTPPPRGILHVPRLTA